MGALTMADTLRCRPALALSRLALAALLVSTVLPLQPALADAPQASPVGIWPKLRSGLFGDRPIREDDADVVQLEAPTRAEDAATVPIAIRAGRPQTPERYIRTLYLLVDNNPSPVAAVFELTPDSGRADIETRIRVEQYTDVRVIAELSDGTLHMARRHVKASGGCSAPAGKDPREAARNAGRMRFRVDGPVEAGVPAVAQLAVSHPNASGLVLDQLTRLYEPAYYVRRLTVRYAGKPVLSADIDFSISENPNFRFHFLPTTDGELQAEVVDTRDLHFETRLAVKPGHASAIPP